MNPLCVSLALAVVTAQLSPSRATAQEVKPITRAIHLHTPNGWMLNVNSDGSGRLQYGSLGTDGWSIKAGTFDVKKVTKDLEALTSDPKGGLGSHFVFHFESERRGPDRPPPARYTRDTKVIPALFQQAIEASDDRRSERKALLLKERPPGLPTEK